MQATPSQRESSTTTKSFESEADYPETFSGDASIYVNAIIEGNSYAPKPLQIRSTSIEKIIGEWSKDPDLEKEIQDARRWAADNFFVDESLTIRSLRLGKGWSQTDLAQAMATSQPHVARIEKGDQDLALNTLRKLAKVLGADMNTIDEALHRQQLMNESAKD